MPLIAMSTKEQAISAIECLLAEHATKRVLPRQNGAAARNSNDPAAQYPFGSKNPRDPTIFALARASRES